MKKQTETDLIRACLDFLRLRGVFCFRVNTTGVFDPTRKVFRTFQGMKGVSDILGLLPPLGRFLAVETKIGRNKPSLDQLAFGAAVHDAGGLWFVVYSLTELDDLLTENGI